MVAAKLWLQPNSLALRQGPSSHVSPGKLDKQRGGFKAHKKKSTMGKLSVNMPGKSLQMEVSRLLVYLFMDLTQEKMVNTTVFAKVPWMQIPTSPELLAIPLPCLWMFSPPNVVYPPVNQHMDVENPQFVDNAACQPSPLWIQVPS